MKKEIEERYDIPSEEVGHRDVLLAIQRLDKRLRQIQATVISLEKKTGDRSK